MPQVGLSVYDSKTNKGEGYYGYLATDEEITVILDLIKILKLRRKQGVVQPKAESDSGSTV